MSSSAVVDGAAILAAGQSKQKALVVDQEVPAEIDLGLLAVFDPNPIEAVDYQTDKEQILLHHARDGIQLLVNQIWTQPTRIVDDGVVAELPPISTALPREKPLPKQKAMTKWEAFAATKGIAPKPRRDRLVFDDRTQEWVPAWGYKGKNKQEEEQWIREVPASADNEFDPIANARKERKERTQKNESQRLKNLQRAAANAAEGQKQAATRLSEREVRKKVIERELKITKTATASMGKFDEKLKGEQKEKNIKRKFVPNEVAADSERKQAMNILNKMPGATPSNKRTKVSDDAPTAGEPDGLINSRVAIKKLTGGRGAMSLEGRRGSGRGRGRGGGRGGRGRGGK